MKKTLIATAVAAVLAIQAASASVTINFGVGQMYATPNISTNFFANGGLLNVLAMTNGNTWASLGDLNLLFSNLTNSFAPTGATRVGFFANDNSGGDGYGNGAITFNLTGGVTTGSQLLLVGYTTLTTNSVAPGLGTVGFFYRDGLYLVPSDGGLIDIYSETESVGGSLPDNTFTSGDGAAGGNGFTTVPEPSTYALLAISAAAFGGYMVRRRKRA
ncbi:MAG: PEP-CTERM sorting domain-containing protein [Chthoniobacterales bacterium]|nr:PEP-CTERM sorting domain-containing protein [Chthoniobacterales bacterium]